MKNKRVKPLMASINNKTSNSKPMNFKVNNIRNMFALNVDIINGFNSKSNSTLHTNIQYCNNLNFIFINSDNEIILDYRIFKLIATPQSYSNIIENILDIIEKVLLNSNLFTIHLCLKSLTLKELENYYPFICIISETLKNKYTDKLEACYIYNAPFIFSQAISLISKIVDKKTQQKIILVK